MSGETGLNRLIATMRPELRDGTYVFVTVPFDDADPVGLGAVMSFREDEGGHHDRSRAGSFSSRAYGVLLLPHGHADGSFGPRRGRIPCSGHNALGCGWHQRERGVGLLSRPSLHPSGTGGRGG